MLDWIEIKERTWEALEGAAWQQLVWNGQTFEPLAVAELNQRLIPQGCAYGAGLSRGQAPTCFLGELQEIRRHDDLTILVLGRELARDLGAAPALRQGPLIYARQETLAYYLWDRLSDPSQQKNAFLRIALAAYGLDLAGLLRHPRPTGTPMTPSWPESWRPSSTTKWGRRWKPVWGPPLPPSWTSSPRAGWSCGSGP